MADSTSDVTDEGFEKTANLKPEESRKPQEEPAEAPHSCLLNDAYRPHPQLKSKQFTCFPRLPAEIRLAIWKHHLATRRIVRLRVQDTFTSEINGRTRWNRWQSDGLLLYADKNELGCVISGVRCWIEGPQAPSTPLLLVNHEARMCALEHFRVRIPIQVIHKIKNDHGQATLDIKDSTFYFNPDFDILHVSSRLDFLNVEAFHFLHDFRAYDPQGVGLMYLAFNNCLWDYLPNLRQFPKEYRQHLRSSLEDLKTVYFIQGSAKLKRETMIGFRVLPDDPPCPYHRQAAMQFMNSYPISTDWDTVQEFHLLETDPREIKTELTGRLCVGRDDSHDRLEKKRDTIKTWFASGGDFPSRTQFKVILSCDRGQSIVTHGARVKNRKEVDNLLQVERAGLDIQRQEIRHSCENLRAELRECATEDTKAAVLSNEKGDFAVAPGNYETYLKNIEQDLAKCYALAEASAQSPSHHSCRQLSEGTRTILPAVGFWTFPIDAFLRQTSTEDGWEVMNVHHAGGLVDLSKWQPELGLAILPE